MPDRPAARRLRPGHHLYRGADGGWRIAAPGDRFTRVHGPDDVLAAAQRRLHAPSEGRAAVGDPVLDGDLERALAAQGLLADVGPGTGCPDPGTSDTAWRVVVAGRNPVGRAAMGLLEAIADVRLVAAEALAEDDVRAADAVLACAGWLPDAHWQRVDAWCARHGTGWHMSYLEGDTWYLGPMAVPGLTATYRDTRARRLAAAAHADELAAHWAYLDDGHAGALPLPPVPWPAWPGPALLAGFLVGDLVACRRAGRPAASGHQLAVDVATATVTRHPVLPLPAWAEPGAEEPARRSEPALGAGR